MKIIEKNGLKLEQILVKRDAFKGVSCERAECLVCRFKPWSNGDMECTKPNALYKANCLMCEKIAEEAKERLEAEGLKNTWKNIEKFRSSLENV